MSVALPSWPAPSSLGVVPVRAGGDLQSPLSSTVQRINRLGDKFRFDVTMPPMIRAHAEQWVACLLKGYGSSVTLHYPQPLGGVGAPGAPVVNGAGQAGTNLAYSGATPGYYFNPGQLFTILSAGKHYAHIVTDQTIVVTGAGALPIWPMLRVSPVNGAALEVVQPVLEGLLEGDWDGWTLDVAQTIGLSFSIQEN